MIIDTEILKNYLPAGEFLAVVNQDSFDDNVFEYYFGEEKDKTNFLEIMFVKNNPENAYVIQGEVVFVEVVDSRDYEYGVLDDGRYIRSEKMLSNGAGHILYYTNEVHTKMAEDVSLLNQNQHSLFQSQDNQEDQNTKLLGNIR